MRDRTTERELGSVDLPAVGEQLETADRLRVLVVRDTGGVRHSRTASLNVEGCLRHFPDEIHALFIPLQVQRAVDP
jgi:hypothetical protein